MSEITGTTSVLDLIKSEGSYWNRWSRWQDIASAPRDQTRFMGVDATGKIAISYYMWPDDKKAVDESEVYSDGYGACGHDRWEPTHWMPLPTPPSSQYTPERPDSQS